MIVTADDLRVIQGVAELVAAISSTSIVPPLFCRPLLIAIQHYFLCRFFQRPPYLRMLTVVNIAADVERSQEKEGERGRWRESLHFCHL